MSMFLTIFTMLNDIHIFWKSRCNFGNHDVLMSLLTNWDDFFWLTGEFPPTFNMIIQQIQQRLGRRRGRRNILDLENQVKELRRSEKKLNYLKITLLLYCN